jgi:transposase InsO family protein
VVDAFSRYVWIYGFSNKFIKAVIQALKDYELEHSSPNKYCYVNIEKIQADHGSQFMSAKFNKHCQNSGINLVLVAPKKKYQNHIAKCTWQTVSTMACMLLTHARLPDTFWYHVLQFSTYIVNVFPEKGLVKEEEMASTPYKLITSQKPLIFQVRVFGCLTIIR